ncbi:MAG TPA: methyltransferase domain-containing protein [Nocardioides sp.]|nr:methyltransferase domain-containing protein [Nocardioides sp.]
MTDTTGQRASPGGFRHSEIGVGGDAQTELLTMLLDLQAAQPGVIRLRDWAFERLAPEPGETAVDVGSGTGANTARLAASVGPAGSATGVEPNPALREVAARRAEATGSPAVYVDGTADTLPLADTSVDVLVCERVLQHVDDPDAAVREFARVLRPGGRVALLDSDWATGITHPGDPELLERYRAFQLTQWANPFSGRRLRGQLLAAGLVVDPDIGSSALVLPDEALRDGGMVALGGEDAVAAGVVTDEELDDIVSGVSAAAARGEAFVSVTMFGVIGRRPR